MTIVLQYLLCGVLFWIVRSASAAVLRHYAGAKTQSVSFGAHVVEAMLEIVLWPPFLVVCLIGWSTLLVKGFSPYLKASSGAAPAFKLTFETRDAGRTWRLTNLKTSTPSEVLPASPLTDRLQDAHTNVMAGLPIGADQADRELALDSDRKGWARKFVTYPGLSPIIVRERRGPLVRS